MFTFHALIELIVIAILCNYFLSFFWKTKVNELIIAIGGFLVILALSAWLKFPILHQILILVSNVGLIAIIVIFQPELRAALSKISLKGKRFQEMTEFDKFLDQLSTSTYRLSEKRIGALIVLEHKDVLDEYASKAVLLNAHFSPELLETIFVSTTPLHDGAIIIREMTIVAASVILPLAEEGSQLTKSMGTRHRAALGLSQHTDAIVIVVSEESGKVSISREGIMTRGVKIDRFKGILRSIFTPPAEKDFKSRFNLREWLTS